MGSRPTDLYDHVSLHAPHLATNAESLVTKAKPRPFLLINRVPEPSLSLLGQNRTLHRKVGVVALISSVVDAVGVLKYDDTMIEFGV